MENSRWRKWFKSTSQTRIPQNEDRGMLKQLIGHWKAHRKKPTLLPEETEVHFEETSTVNPLFEDNDAAVTSEALGELSAVIDSITLDLDKETHDHERTNLGGNLIDIDNEDLHLGSSELSVVSNNDKTASETRVNDHASNIINENEVAEVNDKSSEENKVHLNTETKVGESVETESKTLHETVSRDEQQPSTSSHIPDTNRLVDVEKNIAENKNLGPDMILKIQESPIVSSSSKIKDISTTINKPVTQITQNKSENEVNRLPVISELIKKFRNQALVSESSSPNNISPADQKVEPKVNSPVTKNDFKRDSVEVNKPEKESLSKIFNFPPPPPVEPQKIVPQLKDTPLLKPNKSFLASVAAASKTSNTSKEVKTRSDSSLARNKTVSSETNDTEKPKLKDQTNSSVVTEVKKIKESENLIVPGSSLIQKESSPLTDAVPKFSKNANDTKLNKTASAIRKSNDIKEPVGEKKQEDKKVEIVKEIVPITPQKTSLSAGPSTKQPIQKRSLSDSKKNDSVKSSPLTERKDAKEQPGSTRDNKVPETVLSQVEAKVAKSHSEDSGITRGDQISSEATQDNPPLEPNEEAKMAQPKSSRRSRRERKNSYNRSRNCKHCRRLHTGEVPLKRGKCDEYYDILTGARRVHRGRHSESWASDLSYEEKEFIRRLRNRRETFRSENPPKRSRHSHHRHLENGGYFQRAQPSRHSISDESSFYGSSMCSCDDCWMSLVKDYAYGRASLRGVTPNQGRCTCRPMHPEFLSRKVKFRSDTIPEVPTIDGTLTSSSIPEEEDKKEDTGDVSEGKDQSSLKEDATKTKKANGKTSTDLKTLKEKYRLMTPWEMEEWDLAMRRHLLIKRRKRARNMGLMALAMVIFIGLVVTVVMIYLRRRTI